MKPSGTSTFLDFASAFVANPLQTGSLIPSSRYLARSILRGLELRKAQHVVEYGPGSGIFTRYLQSALGESTRLHLVEMNVDFAQHLKQEFPEANVLTDSAANILQLEGVYANSIDVVVSSLPFTTIPWEETLKTVNETYRALKPGGVFRTYIYIHTLPLAKNQKLLKKLRELFGNVDMWFEARNFPPAFVLQGIK